MDELDTILSDDYMDFLQALVEEGNVNELWKRASVEVKTRWLQNLAEDIHDENKTGERDHGFERTVDWAAVLTMGPKTHE